MSRFRYPCTGNVLAGNFSDFLFRELGEPRANIQAFARELGAAFGAKRISLVNSGSSANLAAALACRQLTKRGEALVAGFTFPTTISALQLAGFTVRIIDTEPGGFNMDPDKLREAITPRTRVVCFTHFLGFPARTEQLCAIARQHDLLVIQDACETMRLDVGGHPAHELGDFTTWSFYHPHHLSAYGGGAVISPRDALHDLAESASHWGRQCTCHYDPARCTAPKGMSHNFWYVRTGQNLEMSELNACFGRYQLRTWPHQEQRRKENYDVLYNVLKRVDAIKVYPAPANNGTPFVFPITLLRDDVTRFAERLQELGVESRTLMGGVIARQPAFAKLRNDGLVNCRKTSDRSLFVGIHQTLPIEDVAAVAEIIKGEL